MGATEREKSSGLYICENWRRGDGCMNGGGIQEFTRRHNTRDDVSVSESSGESPGMYLL